MKIRRRIAFDVLALLLLLVASAASAADFQPVGPARELKGALGIYEWRYQATVGKSPFDQIGLHRVVKGPTPAAHPEAVVLYLPGTNMNGGVALDDPRYSFQVYLAEHGVDVWSMDYRTHFIPPQTPQSVARIVKGFFHLQYISPKGTPSFPPVLSKTPSRNGLGGRPPLPSGIMCHLKRHLTSGTG